jgi:YegS/Rv2252/BmrU family lipid kinase
MSRRVLFIINPVSGFRKDKERLWSLILERVRPQGWELTVSRTRWRGEATELAAQAVDEGYDLIVAVGGDGTVNEVASALVQRDATLGIIPSGSGNGLARSLGIPLDPQAACDVLIGGLPRRIDVGKADERFFFVVAGVGLDAHVGKRFDSSNWRGPVPYFYFGLKEFFVYTPTTVLVELEGRTLEVQPLQVTVANSQQYGNGAVIAPNAKLDDGLLDVCVIHPVNFLQGLYGIPKLFSGKIDTVPYVEFYQSKWVRIRRSEADVLNLDGEPVEAGEEVEITVLPRALNVMAPSESHNGKHSVRTGHFR